MQQFLLRRQKDTTDRLLKPFVTVGAYGNGRLVVNEWCVTDRLPLGIILAYLPELRSLTWEKAREKLYHVVRAGLEAGVKPGGALGRDMLIEALGEDMYTRMVDFNRKARR